MRTCVKSWLLMTGISLLLAVPFVGAADVRTSDKDKSVDPVRICQEKCRGEKDKQAYDEACMLKCKETHQGSSTTVPTIKKK